MTKAEMGWHARQCYAKLSDANPNSWCVTTSVKRETWYDFYDLETGFYGQCMMKSNGEWHQSPRGNAPTILEYRGHS